MQRAFTNEHSPIVDHNGVGKIVAGNSGANWIRINPNAAMRPLSELELTSLNALIAYVAINKGIDEKKVENDLSTRFNIAHAYKLPSNKFEEAVRFLVDSMDMLSDL